MTINHSFGAKFFVVRMSGNVSAVDGRFCLAGFDGDEIGWALLVILKYMFVHDCTCLYMVIPRF